MNPPFENPPTPLPPDAAPTERAWRALAEQVPCAAYVKDEAGRYLFANAAAGRMLGLDPAAMRGSTDEQLLTAELAATLRAADQAALETGLTLRREERLPSPDGGGNLEVLAVRIPLAGPSGSTRLCGVWSDLGEVRQLQSQLRHALAQLETQQRENESLRRELRDQQVLDPASGLYLRRHFDEQLRREIDLSTREQREFSLVSVQVDDVGALQQAHGEPGTQRVLQALGRLLRGNTRAMDAPCRLTEETFAVLLSGVGLATAHHRMEGLRRQCESQLVMLDGQDLRFTISMGVASYPHSAHDRESLLQAASRALQEARARGGNCAALARIPFRP